METFFNAEKGLTTAVMDYKGFSFTGVAHCHPEDKFSEYIGGSLAEQRATREYLRFVRENEIKPQLHALKQLYYSMNKSKNYNPKSYEAVMLQRQIRQREDDLEVIKDYLYRSKKLEKDIANVYSEYATHIKKKYEDKEPE